MAALAVERFRRSHTGAPPASLPDLVPGYLTSVPNDPFNGRPLSYRRDGAAYVIYSVGANRRDDGGDVGAKVPDIGLRISPRQREQVGK